jgi:hypothetical protein
LQTGAEFKNRGFGFFIIKKPVNRLTGRIFLNTINLKFYVDFWEIKKKYKENVRDLTKFLVERGYYLRRLLRALFHTIYG